MRAFVLALLCGLVCSAGGAAPVPKHLFPPPPPDPIRPGFKWWFCGWQCQVVRIDGGMLYYRCLNCPEKVWRPSPCGTPGLSEQPVAQTRLEWEGHCQYPDYGPPEWVGAFRF